MDCASEMSKERFSVGARAGGTDDLANLPDLMGKRLGGTRPNSARTFFLEVFTAYL